MVLGENMYKFKELIVHTIFLFVYVTSCQAHASGDKNVPPNVVIIFADDMGYGDLSSYGAEDLQTPNLDSLAAGGVRFTDSYAISPICSPSRAGLLTGRYPVRAGIHEVFMSSSFTGLPSGELTLAELLRDAGYDTAMFGKWHLGHHEKFMPLTQGFDTFFGYPYSNDISPYYAFEGNDIVQWEVDQTQITQELTARTIEFIAQSTDNPFFIYLAQPMPHVPLASSESFAGSSQRGPYGDVIQELDWSVGEVVQALKDSGKFDNTLLLFASDNGPWLIAEADGGSPSPLRAGKGTTFEGGMRVPTIASWPQGLPRGETETGITTLLDWFPTIAAAANISLPRQLKLDGQNIIPALIASSDDLKKREFAYYNHGEIEAYRVGDWKLKLPNVVLMPWAMRMLATGEDQITREVTLYNLREDIGESNNLADIYPEKVTEIQQAIFEFRRELGPLPPRLDVGLNLSLPDFAKYPLQRALNYALLLLLILIVFLIGVGYAIGRYKRK